MRILAIDPGNVESAFVLYDTVQAQVVDKGKLPNDKVMQVLKKHKCGDCIDPICDLVVIEMVASYGMAVGATVFETCVWVGRFMQHFSSAGFKVERIFRKDIKMHHCGSPRAKDSNIRQALIDKYGAPGTKKTPNMIYADSEEKMSKDKWAAFAIATYVSETQAAGQQTKYV